MSEIKLLSTKKICEVFDRFAQINPDPKSELEYHSVYTLLIAVMLSAQTTDKAVNKVTPGLFSYGDTPEEISRLRVEQIEEKIRTIGLYKNKAKNVLETSRILAENYGGKVPDTMEELVKLPGVGRKTANVVLNVAFGKHTMPVDTHLLRICPKIGLAEGNTPETVEKSLVKRIPDKYMEHAHHWLILHGRYVCTARNPKCGECVISDLCCHNEIQKEAKK